MKKVTSSMKILMLLGDDEFEARMRTRQIYNEVKADHVKSRIAEEVAKEKEREARFRKMKQNQRVTDIYRTMAKNSQKVSPVVSKLAGAPRV